MLKVVRHHLHRCETKIDFGLARGGDFVVLTLNGNASLLELETHFVADVLLAVGRGDGEVTLFRANLITEIRKLLARAVPMAASRAVDEME